MAQQDLTLALTLDDINLLLEGLGSLPYARVFQLIGKLQAQASTQLTPPLVDSPSDQQAID